MRYSSLSQEDFDAIVTGELTHYAIWMENVLVDLISKYFGKTATRKDFERLVLRREGLTFQDKIEIVRAMLPLFVNQSAAQRLAPLLRKVGDFKAKRNAFAHGVDVTPDDHTSAGVVVEVVTRSGKEELVTVTPKSHMVLMDEADALLKELQTVRDELIN